MEMENGRAGLEAALVSAGSSLSALPTSNEDIKSERPIQSPIPPCPFFPALSPSPIHLSPCLWTRAPRGRELSWSELQPEPLPGCAQSLEPDSPAQTSGSAISYLRGLRAGESNFPSLAHLENEGSIITHVKLLAQHKKPISISSSYRCCYPPAWKSREGLQLGEGAAGAQARPELSPWQGLGPGGCFLV